MVRKFAQVSLAVFLVLALASLASAGVDVANTTQKGSLLVFPKVAEFDTPDVTTYFFIGNDNTKPTYVKCYWMDNNQSTEDFHFLVTANQPIVFSTEENEYGPPFGVNRAGTLTCWAQNDEDTNPVKFNHLYGYALIEGSAASVFYNAYSFKALADAPFTWLDVDHTMYQMKLDASTQYDGCPKYLITNFIPDDRNFGGIDAAATPPDMTLWPCKQDLRQDRIPTCTKAKFDIWNNQEVKFTGAYQCFKCFFEGFLGNIGSKAAGSAAWVYNRGKGFGGEKFTTWALGDWDVARVRVQGVKSSVCFGNTKVASEGITCTNDQHVNTALLGVILYGTDIPPVFPGAAGIDPVAGYTMHGAGYDTAGFINADAATGVAAGAR